MGHRETKGIDRLISATHDGVRLAVAAQSLPRAGLAPGVKAPRHHSASATERGIGDGALSIHLGFDFG